jgi:hypothetical protein
MLLARLARVAYKRKKMTLRAKPEESLDLKAGDWVEVRSAEEIHATLDEHRKLGGLTFSPEMMEFCNRRFRVYKRLDKIILEATGELRKLRMPTVTLEGVFCDGEAHGGCDRSCFCLWPEAWLKTVTKGESVSNIVKSELAVRMKEAEPDFCQYYHPGLESITQPDSRRALRLRKIWWKWKRYAWYARVMGLRAFQNRHLSSGGSSQTPSYGQGKTADAAGSQRPLNLEPGELVEVRSEKEILGTLDRNDRLGGLRFTREMSKYCGEKFGVYRRVKKIMMEDSGEMRTITSPTVLLEGVICDGSAHGDCDRACFCYWREEWLKRAAS